MSRATHCRFDGAAQHGQELRTGEVRELCVRYPFRNTQRRVVRPQHRGKGGKPRVVGTSLMTFSPLLRDHPVYRWFHWRGPDASPRGDESCHSERKRVKCAGQKEDKKANSAGQNHMKQPLMRRLDLSALVFKFC
ncbi:hypothetical protein MRX96_046459 [Rhipicephalus microplus]